MDNPCIHLRKIVVRVFIYTSSEKQQQQKKNKTKKKQQQKNKKKKKKKKKQKMKNVIKVYDATCTNRLNKCLVVN